MIYYRQDSIDAEFAAHILQFYAFKRETIVPKPLYETDVMLPARIRLSRRTLRRTVGRYVSCASYEAVSELAYDFAMLCVGGGLTDFLHLQHYIYRCSREPEVLTLFADQVSGRKKLMESKFAFCYFEQDRRWTQYLKDDGLVCSSHYTEEGLKLCSTQNISARHLSKATNEKSHLGDH